MAAPPPSDVRPGRVPGALGALASRAYPAFAGACVLAAALVFYRFQRLELFYSSVRPDPLLPPGDWSAPLDDVFIHFDFARSIARGHPFEWSAGNGYSSGGTSLLYPFALAPGYLLGFAGTRIMQFAAVVACTSTLAALLAARRLFRDLPAWSVYLAPPFLLSIGALNWSLWSGMEVAFFLAVWGLALVAWDDVVHGPPGEGGAAGSLRGALLLGLANAVVVATRPEAGVLVLVFGITAAYLVGRERGARRAIAVLVLSGAFAGGVLVAQAVANRVYTGDWSAAGALVKLEINDPKLTAREVWDAWLFHVQYQVGRVTGHHVADSLALGSLLWLLAAVPLGFARTRRHAALLWLQAAVWVLVTALNGQVRWQNERYTMPAVAFLLLSAALGVAVLLAQDLRVPGRPRVLRVAAIVAAVAALAALAVGQAPQMRDQVWFFGRASRNIRDQHVKVGRRIRTELPSARRVLVGDAGAIPYASDLPALDIIGLGGYPGLPFARASRWGVASAIELIQRIPPRSRPDVMAIYPGWWGELPLWFGQPIDGVSVRGNVICGGLTKMMYRARWESLDDAELPASLRGHDESVVDRMDFADVIEERSHRYRTIGAPGFVTMKLLPGGPAVSPPGGTAGPRVAGRSVTPLDADPDRGGDDGGDDGAARSGVWDAGRIVPPGASATFSLSRDPAHAGRLVLRTAQSQPARLRVLVDDVALEVLTLRPDDGWQETSVSVPPGGASRVVVTLAPDQHDVVLYHLWSVSSR